MNRTKLAKFLNADLDRNKADYKEFLTLREALKPLEGKRVTKHFQKVLPEGYTLESSVNGPHIKAPSGNTHFLAYNGDECEEFKIEKFEERDSPYNRGAKDRIEKLEGILNSEEDFQFYMKHYAKIKKILQLCKEVKNVNSIGYHNPTHYTITNDLLKEADLNHVDERDIKNAI